MTLVIAWRTTKLIECGHRGLQAYRTICYYFYVFFTFFYVFFQNPKNVTFYVFLPCFIRFLELWCQACQFFFGEGTSTVLERLCFLDPEGGCQKATIVVVVVVVGISSLRVQKSLRLFNAQRSATKLCTHIRADIAHRFFTCFLINE